MAREPLGRLASDIVEQWRADCDSGAMFAGGGTRSGHVNCFPGAASRFVYEALEASGALERTVLFLNLASDSSTQRLLTPRFALCAAEYLAFEHGRDVLVVITDMTNYCDALREVWGEYEEEPSI